MCDNSDVLKDAQRSPTTFLLSSDLATFTYRVPLIWRPASTNCSRLRSEPSLWLSVPGARHPANPFLSRAGGRRLRKAANWATMRVIGEAGVVGKGRGWEGPLEASASHSHPSRPPGPPVPRGSADSFVKRGRGSLVLARPRSCFQGPQEVATPSPNPPRTDLLLRRQLILPPTRRESHRQSTRGPGRVRRAPSSPPPSPLPPPPLLGPLLTGGEGNAKLTCAVQRARGPRGGAWGYGSRKAPRALDLKAPERLTDFSLTGHCCLGDCARSPGGGPRGEESVGMTAA